MQQLVEQLKRHEGLRLKPYRDTMGLLTIGYGRNLDGAGISKDEAEAMLLADIAVAEFELSRHLSWTRGLDEARRAVLINMTFNLGISKLLEFVKTLAAVEAGKYEQAASYMLDSKWARQVGGRATELAEQMRTGVYRIG